MSTAENHRKRSHRSESLHRQATTKRSISTITKQNSKVTPYAWLRQKLKGRRENHDVAGSD